MSELLPIAPLLLVAAGGLAVMMLDAFARERAELALVTAMTLGVTAAVSMSGLAQGMDVSEAPEFVTRYLAVDSFGLFCDVAICLGGALAALLAGGYLREHGLERGEFYVLILFSALGGMVLARATDMLTLFIGLETMSLGVYAMAAFRRTSARAVEGAMKYFLLGSFAAALLLFGSALLYGATGHTDFTGIAATIEAGENHTILTILGLMLVTVGLTFKVSAVPFHMWTPDAYEGSVTPATAFMSVVVKAAAFAVMVRVLVGGFGDAASIDPNSGWPAVLVGLAVLSMVYGNVAALQQSNVKRMLAYSSIAHAGYIMVGLAAAHEVSEQAVAGVLLYLLAYTVSNALAFGALVKMGSYGLEAVSYDDLKGAGRRHPGLGLAFILGVLSLMGFPLTAGFMGKWYVFSAAVQAGGGYVWLAVLGVLMSAIGAFYYLKVLVYLFMKQPEEDDVIAIPMKSGYVTAALVIAGYFVLKIGVSATYFDWAYQAATEFIG